MIETQVTSMSESILEQYRYVWPDFEPTGDRGWHRRSSYQFDRHLSESPEDLKLDSRWPAFFPSSICFVTASDGTSTAVEKIVGASIVNRFPYVVALSFCFETLSDRHYARSRFIEMLETGGAAAIQFFEPGPKIDALMSAIAQIPDAQIDQRIAATGLNVRGALTSKSPVFADAYMVYEARLVKSSQDFSGALINQNPFTEHGSHRIYFLEIRAIQLREDIARGQATIRWHSLPYWTPRRNDEWPGVNQDKLQQVKYRKGYTANYVFPSPNTIAFPDMCVQGGMAVLHLPETAKGQVETDSDKARWPCFFPSSVGLITTWASDGIPNLMPCGSTTMLVRNPLCIGIFVSYAEINDRYAKRATLRALDQAERFACGVPFDDANIIESIKYAGNISIDLDADKIRNAGLNFDADPWAPVISQLPITFLCEVVEKQSLGTHIMYLGQVKSIRMRDDVSKDNPLIWHPYPELEQRHAPYCF